MLAPLGAADLRLCQHPARAERLRSLWGVRAVPLQLRAHDGLCRAARRVVCAAAPPGRRARGAVWGDEAEHHRGATTRRACAQRAHRAMGAAAAQPHQAPASGDARALHHRHPPVGAVRGMAGAPPVAGRQRDPRLLARGSPRRGGAQSAGARAAPRPRDRAGGGPPSHLVAGVEGVVLVRIARQQGHHAYAHRPARDVPAAPLHARAGARLPVRRAERAQRVAARDRRRRDAARPLARVPERPRGAHARAWRRARRAGAARWRQAVPCPAKGGVQKRKEGARAANGRAPRRARVRVDPRANAGQGGLLPRRAHKGPRAGARALL